MDTFTKEGEPYRAGDIFSCPQMADTLESLAATGCESFYRGEVAEKIAAFSAATGGWLTREDLAAYKPQWGEPITRCV